MTRQNNWLFESQPHPSAIIFVELLLGTDCLYQCGNEGRYEMLEGQHAFMKMELTAKK